MGERLDPTDEVVGVELNGVTVRNGTSNTLRKSSENGVDPI